MIFFLLIPHYCSLDCFPISILKTLPEWINEYLCVKWFKKSTMISTVRLSSSKELTGQKIQALKYFLNIYFENDFQ